MSETLLKKMYAEILSIRKKLDLLEEILIPGENISEKELREIQRLREECLKGEAVQWEEVVKELLG
ncbi:MAG: hypothetical protein HXS54_02225 [Theionarchaea archaeon]|nr:hypothetical protein [Theionarchaea archaeon]